MGKFLWTVVMLFNLSLGSNSVQLFKIGRKGTKNPSNYKIICYFPNGEEIAFRG